MKQFLKIFGILVGSVVLIAYLSFLFILPNVVDLNKYKPMVQNLVKEQIPLNVDFKNLKITTTPMLSIGVKAEDLSVKFEDNTTLFSADKAKFRIALPSLLLLTVKVSKSEIDNPYLNFTIVDGKQFKILKIVEKILQEQNLSNEETTEEKVEDYNINPELIKIVVPNLQFNNYNILITDLKTSHKLQLKGEKLSLAYYNGKTAKIKTNAEFLSDDKKNITADINIDSFLPPFEKSLDEEDDKPEKVELPFINPVLMYQRYNLTSAISTKLKIREKEGIYKINGFLNIDDTALTLDNYRLPKCYFHGIFKGTKAYIDTNLAVAKNENLALKGMIKYDKNAKIAMNVKSDKIYFHDLIKLTEAYLNSLHIRNDLDLIKGKGYIEANADIQSDNKKFVSNGKILVKDGAIINKNINLGITNTNAEFLFDNNNLIINNAYTYINNAVLKVSGKIDELTNANVSITANSIPIVGLYNAFAPIPLKHSIAVTSGNITINGKITGKVQNALLESKIKLTNLVMRDNKNTFRVNNDLVEINANIDTQSQKVNLINTGLKVSVPATNSILTNKSIKVNINDSKITIPDTTFNFNNNSDIKISGIIDSKIDEPIFNVKADGHLSAMDLKKFAGHEAAPFIKANGSLPVTMTINGDTKRQNLVFKLLTSPANYITFTDIENMQGKNSVLQAKIDFKKNRIKIKETGFYNRSTVTNTDGTITEHLDKIIGLSGTITRLNTPIPFINVIKIDIPKSLRGSLCAFRNSGYTLKNGRLFIFGHSNSPYFNGEFELDNLYIRDLLTKLDKIVLSFNGKNLHFASSNLNLNGSDYNSSFDFPLETSSILRIKNLNVKSNMTDVDKLMMVSKALSRKFPASNNSSSASSAKPLPVRLVNGHIRLNTIKTGNILLSNTTTRFGLVRSRVLLDNIRTHAFDGEINGNVVVNLMNMKVQSKFEGKNINVDKMLVSTANLKNTLTGTLSFKSDLNLSGAASNYEEQIKSLDGNINFNVKNGQIGPFGKFENFILAENIRNSVFFQSALGGIINGLTSIDTTHFENLQGIILLKDGIADFKPIKTNGNVLTIYITGKFDILNNVADMQVRGRLASMISNMLGPISNLNPVNLLKVTPGLNVASAKMFMLFTQPVTKSELDKIPLFKTKTSNFNATNFQVVLNGNVAKPLSLVKSFKWLALQDQISLASSFVNTLPEPETMTSTLGEMEEIEKEQETKGYKMKHLFSRKEDKLREQSKLETQKALEEMAKSGNTSVKQLEQDLQQNVKEVNTVNTTQTSEEKIQGIEENKTPEKNSEK